MLTTSPTLLERLRRADDTAAWTRFVQLYTPLLYLWAKRMGLQDSDADDLVQDVFGLLIKKLPDFRYDKMKSFRSWLRTVAINQWRLVLRKRAAKPENELFDDPVASDTEAFWEEEYSNHLVARALSIMKTDFEATTWQACWETVVNERTTVETASLLGISVSAVRVAKFRVLARLRQELEGFFD